MKTKIKQIEEAIQTALKNYIIMNDVFFNLKLHDNNGLVIITNVPNGMNCKIHEQNIRYVIKDLFNTENLIPHNIYNRNTFDFSLNFTDCDLSKINKIMTFQ